MAEYLKIFNTAAEYDAVVGTDNEPNVSHIIESNGVEFKEEIDYSQNYLTFEILETSSIMGSTNFYYSLDKGNTWASLPSAGITVEGGKKVLWKNTAAPASYSGIGRFSGSGKFKVSGNIMSMIYGDDFKDKTSLSGKNYAFNNLFAYCDSIEDIQNIILPATTLSSNCYRYLFSGLTKITKAPELPATEMAEFCYCGMFQGCTSLLETPKLYATTLKQGSYNSMFAQCNGLTKTAEMYISSADTQSLEVMYSTCPNLVDASNITIAYANAYIQCQSMFARCTSLTKPPVLSASRVGDNSFTGMFGGCTSLVNAPELPATTLNSTSYCYMFSRCTSLEVAPELPARTVPKYAYYQMFNGCSKLRYIKSLATNISASNCLTEWVYGVASTGTFVKPSSTNYPSGDSGIPNGWTIENI